MAQQDSSVGRTVLQSFCSECVLSPRAGPAPVQLCGPGGFPGLLFGQCANCSWEFVAVRIGTISARPLSYVYNPNDELRKALGLSFHCAPGVWELEAADEEAASQAQ